MPQIEANNKVVIRDEDLPTLGAIDQALELALAQGAPPEAEVSLQVHAKGWTLIFRWEPEVVS